MFLYKGLFRLALKTFIVKKLNICIFLVLNFFYAKHEKQDKLFNPLFKKVQLQPYCSKKNINNSGLFIIRTKQYVTRWNHSITLRYYSTAQSNNNKIVKNNIMPHVVKRFPNSDIDRLEILKLSKNKCGIYMWSNNLNNKVYIGSSIHLRRRIFFAH